VKFPYDTTEYFEALYSSLHMLNFSDPNLQERSYLGKNSPFVFSCLGVYLESTLGVSREDTWATFSEHTLKEVENTQNWISEEFK